jgi:hypothetical protein
MGSETVNEQVICCIQSCSLLSATAVITRSLIYTSYYDSCSKIRMFHLQMAFFPASRRSSSAPLQTFCALSG